MSANESERELITQFAMTRDPELRDRVIMSLQPLVCHLARHFADRGVPFEDLVQVGNIGLINAVDRYDISRGTALSTYAGRYIVGEIRRYFRDKTSMIKVPRLLRELDSDIVKVEQSLRAEGIDPTADVVASKLGIPVEAVEDVYLARPAYYHVSIESAFVSEDDPGSFFEDHFGCEDSALSGVADNELLYAAIRQLPPRLQKIISLRFLDGLSQMEVGKRIGCSQMHVSRLQTRALKQMRAILTRDGSVGAVQKGDAAIKQSAPEREDAEMKQKSCDFRATPIQFRICCALWAGFSRIEPGCIDVHALAKALNSFPFKFQHHLAQITATLLEGDNTSGYSRRGGGDVMLQRGDVSIGGIDFQTGHVYRLELAIPKLIEAKVTWIVDGAIVVRPGTLAETAVRRSGEVAASAALTEPSLPILASGEGASIIDRLLAVHPAIVQGEPSSDIATAIADRERLIEHLKMEQLVLEAAQAIMKRPSIKLVP